MTTAMVRERVCVTGAGGFVASWLVKLLLSKNYIVYGTIRRQPSSQNQKYSHLEKLNGALENLKLFEADLLDYESLRVAIEGCSGVFHVACPVPSGSLSDPEKELLDPAVKGTLNVLRACSEANVRRTVMVSSIAAVCMNPNWPKNQPMDETCWSDKEYCRNTNNMYYLAKTEAESKTVEYAERYGMDVVSICPTLVLGPILQSINPNASSLALLKMLREGYETMENRNRWIVDVRDVAQALLLVYEKTEAKGRYICTAHTARSKDVVEKLKSTYPDFSYPKSWTDVSDGDANMMLSSEKLQKLGWSYKALEETLIDSVESYRDAGLI